MLDLRRLQWQAAAETARSQQQAAAVPQQQYQQGRAGAAGTSAAKASSCSTAVVPGGWGWQAAASAALQSALTATQEREVLLDSSMDALLGQQHAQTEDAFGVDSSDASRGEMLAKLVEQLGEMVPDVQVLVLPVLLPQGR